MHFSAGEFVSLPAMRCVRTWKERLEEARPHELPAMAVLILVGPAGWLAWRGVLPRVADEADAPGRLAARQQAANDVDLLEKSYRQAIASSAAESVVAAQLDRIIERQRARARHTGFRLTVEVPAE